MPSPLASVPYYHQHAERLAAEYDRLAPEQLHAAWRDQLPAGGGRVLDVGSGSGRDACWLAASGYQVTAVEPAAGMRERAQQQQQTMGLAEDAIDWVDDALPSLSSLGDKTYRLILLSAVWMHLSADHRPRALRRLARLLDRGGVMIITLRFGPSEQDRPMYPASEAEVRSIARPMGMSVTVAGDGPRPDLLGRARLQWQTLILQH